VTQRVISELSKHTVVIATSYKVLPNGV